MDAQGPDPAFLDWWFAPWRDAGAGVGQEPPAGLARRDAYRHWCAQAGLRAPLPPAADWRWQDACALDGGALLAAAELFGGLLAARRQRHAELAALDPVRRRWCLALAPTQPLVDWQDGAPGMGCVRQRGLHEFALRAERALPGMWPRLALRLAPDQRPRLAPAGASGQTPLRERDRRCWQLCVARALIDQNHDRQEP